MFCSRICRLWSPSPLDVHETLAVQRGDAKNSKAFNDPMDPVKPPLMADPRPPPSPPFPLQISI